MYNLISLFARGTYISGFVNAASAYRWGHLLTKHKVGGIAEPPGWSGVCVGALARVALLPPSPFWIRTKDAQLGSEKCPPVDP